MGRHWTLLVYTGQYWVMQDNIRQCQTILGTTRQYSAIFEYSKNIKTQRKSLNDIEQYWIIFYNIAQYCTILGNIQQYLKISYNIVVYLAISEVISCHRGNARLFQNFTFHYYYFFFHMGEFQRSFRSLKVNEKNNPNPAVLRIWF